MHAQAAPTQVLPGAIVAALQTPIAAALVPPTFPMYPQREKEVQGVMLITLPIYAQYLV